MSQVYLGSSRTPSVATSFVGNTGTATPAANILNVIGTGNVNVSAAGSTLTISQNASHLISSYTQISFADSPYSVLSTDYFISVDSSGGPVSVLLPNSPTTLSEFVIKDRGGNATTNNITISTVGGVVLIDGSTSQSLSDDYESIDIIYNGSTFEVY